MSTPPGVNRKLTVAPLLWVVLLLCACRKMILTPAIEAGSFTQRAFPIMGTVFSVSIWNEDASLAEQAIEQAHRAVIEVDLAASNYKGDSELAIVHKQRTPGPILLSPILFELLSQSVAISKKTEGLLDVTIGPLVELWGFHSPLHGEPRSIPSIDNIKKTKDKVGYQKLKFNNLTLELPAGMKLDFGATGKGYALDRAVIALKKRGIKSAALNLGDQLYFLGNSPNTQSWEVTIRDPEHPDQQKVTLTVPEGSISTSSSYARFFTHGGKRYSHLLDPRTGWPSLGNSSVTVWAPTGLEADGYSTALFISGPKKGKAIAKSLRRFSAVWINGGKVQYFLMPGTSITR